MNSRRASVAVMVIALLSIAALAGLVWANFQLVEFNIGGGGFFTHWISTRALLQNGSNPYSQLVAQEIQERVAGDWRWAGEPLRRYTSPLYSSLISLPFALFSDSQLSHTLWMTVQEVAIVGLLVLWMRITAWKPAWYILVFAIPLLFFGYQTFMPLMDGGMVIWSVLFLILSLNSIRNHRDDLAGALLALSTIQPMMVALLVGYVLLWAIFQRRRLLVFWFFGMLAILMVVGMFIIPDWLLHFLRTLWNYPQYFTLNTPGMALRTWFPGLGKQMGWLLSGVVGLTLLFEWWLSLKRDFRWFLWTASLTIVLGAWLGIPVEPNAFLILIIPMILVIAVLDERWLMGGRWAALGGLTLIFIWQWALFWGNLSNPKGFLGLIFPLPGILLLGLYWVRWWAIRPRRLLVEELRAGEEV